MFALNGVFASSVGSIEIDQNVLIKYCSVEISVSEINNIPLKTQGCGGNAVALYYRLVGLGVSNDAAREAAGGYLRACLSHQQ
ncbi:MAG: hypothetical protein JXR51_04740 [Bacteroidales bacterium]|nr:hypothetical protein [Bacteroidales bacterium]MBN2756465.1 hypothetical protein [Bacteroidales bacterium]